MMKKNKKNPSKNQASKNYKAKMRRAIRSTLMKRLGWSERIAQIASRLVVGFLSTVQGVWQKKLALAMSGDGQTDAKIKALQRFLSNTYLNYHLYSCMLYDMLQIQGKVTILIDRTNWDFGRKHINIFVACVLVRSYNSNQVFAVPIAWKVFTKKGNTNTEERKELMEAVIKIVGIENIEMVLGDREFIGEKWIRYLYQNGIPFDIRIKKNMKVIYEGKEVSVSDLFEGLKQKEKKTYSVEIDGIPVTLAGTLSATNELVVAMAYGIEGDPLDSYRLRWLIELFFKSIKTRSFNIEETHMTDPEKINLLFALISYATVLAVQAGQVRNYYKKISVKKNGRYTYSLFTYGYDLLRGLFNGTIPRYLAKLLEAGSEPYDFHTVSIEVLKNYAVLDG